MTNVRDKFQRIEEEMNEFFIERNNVIRGLLVSLLSEQNVVFIGPPGTSKSMIVKELSKRIKSDSDEDYFEWLMTKFTKPEEILGPMMIEELIKGKVKFNPEYKLPKAKIAYLDEVFKANSSILNSLLTALNEKVVYNDNKPTAIPLQMLVGTSNEIPTDESLKALYDRFRIRFETEYIKEPKHLKSLIDLRESDIKRDGVVTDKDINEAREQIDNYIKFPDEKKEILCKIIYSLDNIKCRPSDRTINNVTRILKAEAWMNGKVDVDESDMEFLEHCLWDEPKKRKQIRSTILEIVNPLADNVLEIYEKVHMSYLTFLKDIKGAKEDEKNKIISGVCGTMMTLKDEMVKDIETMKAEKRPVAKYENLVNSVMLLIAEIRTEYVGKLPDSHTKPV